MIEAAVGILSANVGVANPLSSESGQGIIDRHECDEQFPARNATTAEPCLYPSGANHSVLYPAAHFRKRWQSIDLHGGIHRRAVALQPV